MIGTMRLANGRRVLLLDAAQAAPTVETDETGAVKVRVLGYRQTKKPAVKGGTANRKGIRTRNEAVLTIGPTFEGQPFLAGHDWSDPRSRGGTISHAWVEETDDELLVYFELDVTEEWAKAGLESGTIDRFSWGVMPIGEIVCTVHEAPVFTQCYCFPGQTITLKDGKAEREVIAEWEIEDGEGLELSAVNVPAVRGTAIVNDGPAPRDRRELLVELSALCGRQHPELACTAPVPAPITAAAPVASVDTAAIATALGLTGDATPEQISARAAELEATRVQLARDQEAAHVDSEIKRLIAARDVPMDVLVQLRAVAADNGRAAFDAQLSLVERTAPARTVAIGERPVLQSDAAPAQRPGAAPELGDEYDGPNAYDANRDNPHLHALMKRAGVTADDVRKHGARSITVLPNLRELADATAKRGA